MKPTLKFDFKKNDFVIGDNGKPVILEGMDALKMWIEKRLRTMSMGNYKMYRNTSYDGNIDDLVIGKTYDVQFTESELKREITEALTAHDDITSVNSFSFERVKDNLTVNISLTTIYGQEDLSYDII